MRLAISRASCQPLRPGAPIGGRCGGCKIELPEGLEWHALPVRKGEQARRVRLCPSCHLTQHLDIAGQRDAGHMIWCPELQQTQISLLTNIIAGALQGFQRECKAIGADEFGTVPQELEATMNPGVLARHATLVRQVTHLLNIYQSLHARSENMAGLTGFEPAYGAGLVSPSTFGQVLETVATAKNLSPDQIQARIDGVRFLPSLTLLRSFGELVDKHILSKHPILSWSELGATPGADDSTADPEMQDYGGKELHPDELEA